MVYPDMCPNSSAFSSQSCSLEGIPTYFLYTIEIQIVTGRHKNQDGHWDTKLTSGCHQWVHPQLQQEHKNEKIK